MPNPNETSVNPIDEDERFVGVNLPLTNSRFQVVLQMPK